MVCENFQVNLGQYKLMLFSYGDKGPVLIQTPTVCTLEAAYG